MKDKRRELCEVDKTMEKWYTQSAWMEEEEERKPSSSWKAKRRRNITHK